MKQWINYVPGAEISYFGKKYLITNVLNLEEVIAKSVDEGENRRLLIKDIQLVKEDEPGNSSTSFIDKDLVTISDKDWQLAQKRFNVIRPILNLPKRTSEMVESAAQEAGVHAVTIYRWITRYEESGKVSSLVSIKKDGGKGRSRLSPELEKIISQTVDEVYLNEQQRSISKTIIEVNSRCNEAGIKAPHENTIRNRIKALSDQLKISRRLGTKKAKTMFNPTVGHFPGADYPLSVIQIDHTPLDIELVDEQYRLAIGKPWLTLAIDVYSRMVFGLHLSLDPPGDMAVGLCLVNGILPKDTWLLQHDIKTSWSIWGIPRKIHADNGREFHGKMLRRASEEYGIDLEWRPVATPNYGGHIERLLGTFLKEIHDLPGTTFSNPEEKGDYNSENKAALTIVELESILTQFITGVYHQRFHKTIQSAPIKKYEAGILGTNESPGTGLPIRIADEEKLHLDFMPYFERTVQDYGVVLDDIRYYSDVLRRFINARDPENLYVKQKFIFKRDPRDISVLYFFDPEIKRYFAIPYRNTSYPPMSLWELRKVKKYLMDKGREDIDETLIFNTYREMRKQTSEAIKKTKKTRRENERRSRHELTRSSSPLKSEVYSFINEEINPTTFNDEILPFEDMEIYQN